MHVTKKIALRIALDKLGEPEVKNARIYWDRRSFDKSTPYYIGNSPVNMSYDYRVVFIDLAPGANWGHPCEYIFIDSDTGNPDLIKGYAPPKGADLELLWPIRDHGDIL